jgi:hypothetical protein
MAYVLQEKINEVARYATEVVLGYGLCGNGIAGVTAINQRLIVPRFHDCIGLFFGSQAAYANAFNSRPGTFYLSPGFIAERKDPLSIVEEEYASRVGMQKAKWVMEIELKHYTHIVLINTGVTDLDALRRLRQRTLENVVFFNKQYDEIHVTLDYFEKLISGPYTEEDFFILKPGEKIVQEMFYEGLLAK